MCFTSTIVKLAPDSSRILSVQYLALPSLSFSFTSSTGVLCLFLTFYLNLLDYLSYIITFLPPCLFLAVPLHQSMACKVYVIIPQS